MTKYGYTFKELEFGYFMALNLMYISVYCTEYTTDSTGNRKVVITCNNTYSIYGAIVESAMILKYRINTKVTGCGEKTVCSFWYTVLYSAYQRGEVGTACIQKVMGLH